ncbi:hypothetical protein GCM10023194_22370 [Planotetraspora phitsanulokensis]|uniref:Uncharacterized protein n=1 Tax=Planotetraspora phitsanulokensis TaxID=575192 RepID=A0A8J3U952_9ACTN|nr:hypothetical protein [Planotetraspora phitsanulokensis]GII38294.1 hypothetical protein Pph01_32970 [Planotetraspora phitsanulokensis]
MSVRGRTYRYVGPADLRVLVRPGGEGRAISSSTDLDEWVSQRPPAEREEAFTFVVDVDGVLRLAPRRSEHVVCAGGGRVLSAGEISFRHDMGRWLVDEVSNQSTGYCPDVSSWPAVAEALEHAGIEHPAAFTLPVVFRRCPDCREHNIVREDDFVCVFCGSDLPHDWNVDPRA